jgi:hypothetical protein
MIRSTRDAWLSDCARLSPGERLLVYPRGDLDYASAQAALDAQYGKAGNYRASTHGNSLRVERWADYRRGIFATPTPEDHPHG